MGQPAKLTDRETTPIKAGASRPDDSSYRNVAALLAELHRAYPSPAPTEAAATITTLRTEFAKAQLAELKQVALAMGVPLFVSRPRS